ncbi:MAG: hypothetical protein JW969_12455 [Spirochaetales bacterium]|nr:hypothetical protein [Spirochaetales bacterium]
MIEFYLPKNVNFSSWPWVKSIISQFHQRRVKINISEHNTFVPENKEEAQPVLNNTIDREIEIDNKNLDNYQYLFLNESDLKVLRPKNKERLLNFLKYIS